MPRSKAINVRSDRISAILRDIAQQNLPLRSLEILPAGKVTFTFFEPSLDVAAPQSEDSVYRQMLLKREAQAKGTRR